jgi:hypothetical protein
MLLNIAFQQLEAAEAYIFQQDGAPCYYSDAAPIALNERLPGHSTGSEGLFTRLQSLPGLILHKLFRVRITSQVSFSMYLTKLASAALDTGCGDVEACFH